MHHAFPIFRLLLNFSTTGLLDYSFLFVSIRGIRGLVLFSASGTKPSQNRTTQRFFPLVPFASFMVQIQIQTKTVYSHIASDF